MKEFRGTKGEWLVDDIDVISRETGFAICQVYDGLDTHISRNGYGSSKCKCPTYGYCS